MPTFHQIIKSDKMITLNRRTDGNVEYHLLPVACSDYVAARFAIQSWLYTSAHQLVSQCVEKFIKQILQVNKGGYPKKHQHIELLEENRDIPLFDEILRNENYMELIGVLCHEDFIATRYGENYLSFQFPQVIETLDSLVYDFLCAIPHGPKTKKVRVPEEFKDIVLRGNKKFDEGSISIIKL